MPEGHVIHHLARKHQRWMAGQVLRASSPQGRFADGAEVLDGGTLRRAEAKGKHLFLHVDSGAGDVVLHVHLGLYGRTRFLKAPAPEPRGAVRLRLEGATRTWDLVGPTRCALLTPAQHEEKLASLGEDPLREDAQPEKVIQKMLKTKRAIGAVLLDQSVIAGLGNVYRAELAFLAGVHPRAPSCTLSERTHEELWANSVTLLRVGAQHNRIQVLGEEGVVGPRGRDGVEVDGWTVRGRYGRRPDRLWVYKRSACKVCETGILQETLAARTVYFCPSCQVGP